MDKNLNLSKKLPWWVVVIQFAPLVLQLVGELIERTQGIPGNNPGTEASRDTDFSIPDPLDGADGPK